MKMELPKQFMPLYGKPIMVYALDVLEKIESIENIYIMCHPDFMDMYEKILEDYRLEKCTLVAGGETRQDSVQNGLAHVKSDRVLIHEAARPLISEELVNGLLQHTDPAVVPTIPVTFTVSAGDDVMTEELDRSKLHNVQLPQVFDTEILRRAHKAAQDEGYNATEDGILVFRIGETVRFIQGAENNIKITTPFDKIIVERMLDGQ
ncbi:MAG: 2-C-methyl-D-erythritol 4-phosphate cytidylyltransferase [Phycisphaerales bacterium]|nr:2-C-methyl-D-erythritol 4-phosphate cytidylyltransferase [Phycisphaerales bacterium]MBT7171099.1 2-C-methyl-D-erythritol 4-phosphate cytidylyltransferase [Phycisphaerales bacterium]